MKGVHMAWFRPRVVLELLHVWWPVALGWSVAMVAQRATGRPWDTVGVAVLLSGIAAAYSLDRALDAAVGGSTDHRRLLLAVTTIAAALGGALVMRLPAQSAAVVPVAGLVALTYRRLKHVPFAKTLGVPLVWTWCGLALPAGDGSWFGWRIATDAVALPLFLLFASGCLLCDLKDATRDRERGVPSVPALLGPAVAARIAVAVAAAAFIAAAFAGRPALACGALALCAIGRAPALVSVDNTGPLLVDVAMTLPGLLIAARLV